MSVFASARFRLRPVLSDCSSRTDITSNGFTRRIKIRSKRFRKTFACSSATLMFVSVPFHILRFRITDSSVII